MCRKHWPALHGAARTNLANALAGNWHKELTFHQFYMACHQPQHPCHQLCNCPPDDRPKRRRCLIGRFIPKIKQYLAKEPLSYSSYMSAICSIHQYAVKIAIDSSSSKQSNCRTPPIATAEQTLPRMKMKMCDF